MSQTGRWNDVTCTDLNTYICKMPKGHYPLPSIQPTIYGCAQVSYGLSWRAISDPDPVTLTVCVCLCVCVCVRVQQGWDVFEYSCYWFEEAARSHEEAKAFCESQSSTLLHILDL